ncbi:hypothetical protein [Bacillus toyonensis]|uniref:hypothetical protein n=1 Tax=Bacillus toyonensis TaxID=155322 RepID=UPI000BF1381E|nr:hypothetical protein [Bacillus toyonensis]PEK36184.1 hypothetical protein CN897_08320 [Bacillus toyonensis]
MLYNLLNLKQEANGLIAGLNGRDISSMSVMEKARYSNSISKVRIGLESYKNADQETAIYIKELDYLRGQLAGVEMPQQETVQQKNKRRAEVLQNGLANTPYPIPQSIYYR